MLQALTQGEPGQFDSDRTINHYKARSSFANGDRITNPFKQDRKKATVLKQMITINGRIRHVGSNQQKQIQYDPKILAHMAKMYMAPH